MQQTLAKARDDWRRKNRTTAPKRTPGCGGGGDHSDYTKQAQEAKEAALIGLKGLPAISGPQHGTVAGLRIPRPK